MLLNAKKKWKNFKQQLKNLFEFPEQFSKINPLNQKRKGKQKTLAFRFADGKQMENEFSDSQFARQGYAERFLWLQ